MKIKVVKQHDVKDCGVCCLKSIILYYEGYVSLEKLRLDTHTDTKGTSALNLIEASKKYGFDSMGVRVDNLGDNKIKLPAIAHVTLKNGLDHFVVIYKITKKNVYLMDPAKGKVTMKIDDFNLIWNNVLLEFYPKKKIVVFSKSNSLISVFAKIFKNERKLFLVIIWVSLVLSVLTILSSYYFKIALDAISNGKDLAFLKIVIIVFALLIIFKMIFYRIRHYLENHLNKNIDVLLYRDFIKHLFYLPLEVITSRTTGEIMTRIEELGELKNLFVNLFVSCFLDCLLVIISIPFLYNINHDLFFILFLMVIIYLAIGLVGNKIIYKRAYNNIDLGSDVSSTLIESINLFNSTKNLNQTKYSLRRIEEKLAPFFKDTFHLNNTVNNQNSLKMIITEGGMFIINTVGFFLIFKEKLTLTSLITFNTLLTFFLDPLKNIIDSLPKYGFIKASFSKINEFLGIEEEVLGEENLLTHNDIKVCNLNYSYNNYNVIIKNKSLEIAEGDFVLLKGPSGCGKSTLCKLLHGQSRDFSGDILINNISLKDYSLATIRKNIIFVSQNECLYTATIKDNILFGRDISLDKFKEVCDLCHIEDIVKKKAFRYETMISEESSFISGGEKQRIILARALLQEAKIILIDEALSEVDYKTEQIIIKNLQKYLVGKTVIYITHKNHEKLFSKIITLENNYGL